MESITNLFKKTPDTKTKPSSKKETLSRPKKSQEELRNILENKIQSQKLPIEQSIDKYRQSLKDGTFEDGEDEEEGSGEERKKQMQERIERMMDRAEKMKSKLDNGEELPLYTEDLSTTYTSPDKSKTEQITINIEQKLQEFISFYNNHNIEIPEDLEETILELWEENIDDIEKEIQEHGFNEILLVPPTTDLLDLAEKMKETGYYESDNFKEGGSFEKAQSQNQDKIRLILTHNTQNLKDHPELAKTLNIKGQDVPLDQTLTLEEYLILSKKYFEETGKHLDEDGWTWLATKSGSRLVYSSWDVGECIVYAIDFSCQNGLLGLRSSRSYSR